MSECIFCKIARGEIPGSLLYADERVVAFSDIDPQAPTHLLIVPRAHYANLLAASAEAEGRATVAHILSDVVPQLAARLKLGDGFRVVINTGRQGGQTVGHLHVHLLAGRDLQWPPG